MAKRRKLLTLKNGKYWAKKVNGKVHYFGTDYEEACAEYKRQKPFLEAGIDTPGRGPTLADLLNEFLSDRRDQKEEGRLAQQTFNDYVEVCDIIASALPVSSTLQSLKVEQFSSIRKSLAKGKKKKVLSLKSQDRRLGYARAIFRFASIDNFLIDRPLPFTRPLAGISKLEMRRYRAGRPARRLTAEEIKGVLETDSPVLKAAVLLAINGGLNNSDIRQLTVKVATPESGVMVYPRRKTFFNRVTPLWPETQLAISEVLKARPKTKSDLLLISPEGISYQDTKKKDPISRFFTDALRRNKTHAPGKNFGALRTMFAQVGKEVGDDIALKAAMGHSDGSQLYESYADGVYLPRIKRITDHVHQWLFGVSSD